MYICPVSVAHAVGEIGMADNHEPTRLRRQFNEQTRASLLWPDVAFGGLRMDPALV
jgi:hypothetical protein